MKWNEAETRSLTKLRDLLLTLHDDVFSESLCETEELITWGWHADTSILKEHGVMDVVDRLINSTETVRVGGGYFSEGSTQQTGDQCVQLMFELPVDIDADKLRYRARTAPELQ